MENDVHNVHNFSIEKYSILPLCKICERCERHFPYKFFCERGVNVVNVNVHNVHTTFTPRSQKKLYGKRRSQRSQILHKGNILYFSIEKL